MSLDRRLLRHRCYVTDIRSTSPSSSSPHTPPLPHPPPPSPPSSIAVYKVSPLQGEGNTRYRCRCNCNNVYLYVPYVHTYVHVYLITWEAGNVYNLFIALISYAQQFAYVSLYFCKPKVYI